MRVTIGIDVGGTAAKGGLIDVDGRVVERTEFPTDPSAATKSILAVAEDLLVTAKGMNLSVGAVGIGAAGFIDAATGSVTFSPNLTYDEPRIADVVSSRTGLKTVVDNDANAAAWGERTYGAARGFDHVVMLTLGTGIGSGLIVDGGLVRGASGAGAEAGHMVIDPDGPQCPCGLKGCLERFASGSAIAEAARKAVLKDPKSAILDFASSPEQTTGEDVARAAREYDETARSVMLAAGRALGVGMSNLVNLFDPEVIVLGGSVIGAGEPYLGPARDTLNRMLDAQRRRPVRLVQATLGNDAGLIGAAALAAEVA
ncbi:MAG: ROK family protein [Actinomycetota bacterium]